MKRYLTAFFSLYLILHTNTVFAFDIATAFFGSGTKHTTLGTIYNPIIQFIYVLAGLVVLFSFLVGGFKIIQGTPKDLEEGRNIIFYSFVGIIVLVAVYWLVEIIGTVIGTKPLTGSLTP